MHFADSMQTHRNKFRPAGAVEGEFIPPVETDESDEARRNKFRPQGGRRGIHAPCRNR